MDRKLFTRRTLLSLVVLFVMTPSLGLMFSTLEESAAQEAFARWAAPQVLFDTSQGYGEHHSLVADLFGNAHLVWEHNPSAPSLNDPNYRPDDTLFYYNRWNGNEWTPPVDVLFGNITYPRIAADPMGKLHLVFANTQCTAYTSAPVLQADSAQHWSQPNCIGPRALNHAVAADSTGALHAVLAQSEQLLYIQSTDGGATWSNPVAVTETPGNATYVPSLVADVKGSLHAVWTEAQLPDGIPMLGIYYSRSDDGGQTWTTSQQLMEGNYRDPNVTVFDDNVYVVWNSGVVISRRFLAYSQDRGRTWTEPILIVEAFGGWLWHPGITADSAGTIHIITAQGVGALYTTFLPDGRKTQPLQLFDPNEQTSAPDLVTIGGNQLLTVFRGAGSLVYVVGTTPAPSVAPLPLPTSAPELSSTPTKPTPVSAVGPIAEATENISPLRLPAEAPRMPSRLGPFLWGVVPTTVFLVGIVIFSLRRRNRGYRR